MGRKANGTRQSEFAGNGAPLGNKNAPGGATRGIRFLRGTIAELGKSQGLKTAVSLTCIGSLYGKLELNRKVFAGGALGVLP